MTDVKYLSSILLALVLVTGVAAGQQDAAPSEASDATAMPESDSAQAPAAAEADDMTADTQPAPMAAGSVARSAFTTSVQDHEPVDQITVLTNDNSKVYFFTELSDLNGQQVTHRWEYNGEVMAEVPFNVNGDRWRVWSSKNLQPGWTGEWKVSVINGSGNVIASETLQYEAAPEKADMADTQEPAAEAETDMTDDASAPAAAQ